MNREDYLMAAVEKLRPVFDSVKATLPDVVRVSVGFPSRRGLSLKKRVIGECWHSTASKDGVHQIFISPLLSTGVEALETLVHELAHAALPDGTGHKGPFAKLAKALGLTGKPTATSAGPELKQTLDIIIEQLGAYPHSALSATALMRKKQTTRLLKATCPTCGYTVRVTQKWVEVGLPICPTDNITLEEEEGNDEDSALAA